MKTPRFWSAKTRLSTALLPLSCLYRALTRTRNLWINPVTLPIPVICIGNLTAGGAGKTPVALHIGGMLREKNIQACFLTRGYKGRKPGPLLVDPAVDDARAVGDEPLLLSRILPKTARTARSSPSDRARNCSSWMTASRTPPSSKPCHW
jgi:tetraacyldisaccharide 4'-kinase